MLGSDNQNRKVGKKEFRVQAKAMVAKISMQRRQEAAEYLKHDLAEFVQKGMAVLAYATLAGEIEVEPALKGLLSNRVPIFLPKVEGETMEFLSWQGEELFVNQWGIREPRGDKLKWRARDFAYSLVLLPGLLFDQRGYRLGHGKGYYDRFLCAQTSSNITRVGILFEEQLVAQLPAEPWDQRVDQLWRY